MFYKVYKNAVESEVMFKVKPFLKLKRYKFIRLTQPIVALFFVKKPKEEP